MYGQPTRRGHVRARSTHYYHGGSRTLFEPSPFSLSLSPPHSHLGFFPPHIPPREPVIYFYIHILIIPIPIFMTPTTYTKESPRIAHLGRRLVKKWVCSPLPSPLPHARSLTISYQVSLNRKRSSKPSNHRSTVSNPTIPSSSFATLPPAPDLMEAIQSGQGIHDIVFPPET